MDQPTCQWAEDADGGPWETSCGHLFILNDGGPNENGLKFCPFCGKPLEEVKPEEEGA